MAAFPTLYTCFSNIAYLQPPQYRDADTSIDLDESRSEESCGSDLISAREWSGGVGNNSDGKPVHDELVEWEESLDGNIIAVSTDDLGLLHDWQILLVGEDNADGVEVCAVVREAELKLLALWLDVRGVDGESTEDWQIDDVRIRAGTWDDHHLVEHGESPWSSRPGQEGELGRNEVE